jgi:hypothetical protein
LHPSSYIFFQLLIDPSDSIVERRRGCSLKMTILEGLWRLRRGLEWEGNGFLGF